MIFSSSGVSLLYLAGSWMTGGSSAKMLVMGALPFWAQAVNKVKVKIAVMTDKNFIIVELSFE